jgi:hypothetical protein
MLFMVPAADGTIIDLQQLWLEILAAGEDGDLAR